MARSEAASRRDSVALPSRGRGRTASALQAEAWLGLARRGVGRRLPDLEPALPGDGLPRGSRRLRVAAGGRRRQRLRPDREDRPLLRAAEHPLQRAHRQQRLDRARRAAAAVVSRLARRRHLRRRRDGGSRCSTPASRALRLVALLLFAAAFNVGVDHYRLLRLVPRRAPAARRRRDRRGAAAAAGLRAGPGASPRRSDCAGGGCGACGDAGAFVVPVLAGALERSIQRAESLDARGFGSLGPAVGETKPPALAAGDLLRLPRRARRLRLLLLRRHAAARGRRRWPPAWQRRRWPCDAQGKGLAATRYSHEPPSATRRVVVAVCSLSSLALLLGHARRSAPATSPTSRIPQHPGAGLPSAGRARRAPSAGAGVSPGLGSRLSAGGRAMIEVSGLSFAYPHAAPPVLRQVTLSIQEGEAVLRRRAVGRRQVDLPPLPERPRAALPRRALRRAGRRSAAWTR